MPRREKLQLLLPLTITPNRPFESRPRERESTPAVRENDILDLRLRADVVFFWKRRERRGRLAGCSRRCRCLFRQRRTISCPGREAVQGLLKHGEEFPLVEAPAWIGGVASFVVDGVGVVAGGGGGGGGGCVL